MTKRIFFGALVLAALLLLAAPALAVVGPTGPGVQGYRADFSKSSVCQGCHTSGQAGAPKVYPEWAGTKHGELASDQPSRAPSSFCAGCHTSNYDPTKATPVASPYTLPTPTSATPSPTPTATKTAWVYPYTADAVPSDTTSPYPFTEGDVGCSSCHYGTIPSDANDTAHNAPFGNLANADVCGQCHSRYSYTKQVYTVPYFSPTPGAPSGEMQVQMQAAIGYQMQGDPGNGYTADPLGSVLNYSFPGWSPSPAPSTSASPAFPGSATAVMTYWHNADSTTTIWQNNGHDGSAAQYPEWSTSLHANSLKDLKAVMGPNPPQSCLQCHSADYQIAVQYNTTYSQSPGDGRYKTPPTGSQAKYGDTCASCHLPHQAGQAKGVWDPGFDAQLVGDPANPSDVCTRCHVAQDEGGADLTASNPAAPGSSTYNDQKQIMAGVGAIDVPNMPGVHEGKCVDCHMPPTSYSRGSVQLGGNHTMEIIDPQVAAAVSPIPVATATSTVWVTVNGTPSPSPTTVVTTGVMPFSACSTCHGKASDPLATYLGDTITQRQAQMHAWDDQATSELTAAAGRLGYASIGAANTAINAKPQSGWADDQLAFQKSFTNQSIVEKEGSWGIHNYQYASAVIKTSIAEAQSVRKAVSGISITSSAASVAYGSPVTISGQVAYADGSLWTGGQVAIYRQNTGSSVKALAGTVWLFGLNADMYAFTDTPTGPATYWAKFLGSTSYGSGTSSTTVVGVNYMATLKTSATSVKAGHKVTLSGAITPGVTSGTVTIQRKSGSAWKKWTTKAVTTAGTFSISKKLSKGTYYLRAAFPAGAGYGAGTSKQIKVVAK